MTEDELKRTEIAFLLVPKKHPVCALAWASFVVFASTLTGCGVLEQPEGEPTSYGDPNTVSSRGGVVSVGADHPASVAVIAVSSEEELRERIAERFKELDEEGVQVASLGTQFMPRRRSSAACVAKYVADGAKFGAVIGGLAGAAAVSACVFVGTVGAPATGGGSLVLDVVCLASSPAVIADGTALGYVAGAGVSGIVAAVADALGLPICAKESSPAAVADDAKVYVMAGAEPSSAGGRPSSAPSLPETHKDIADANGGKMRQMILGSDPDHCGKEGELCCDLNAAVRKAEQNAQWSPETGVFRLCEPGPVKKWIVGKAKKLYGFVEKACGTLTYSDQTIGKCPASIPGLGDLPFCRCAAI